MRRLLLSLLSTLTLACASSPAPDGKDDAGTPAPQAEDQAPASENASATEAAAAAGLCSPPSQAEWQGCTGKRTRLVGRRAEFVQQHPMLSQPEGLNPDNRNTHQGYMDVGDGGGQVIVLTSAPFDCPAGMTVEGELEHIDLGGEAGTKESYSGWALRDAAVSCD